MPRHAALCALFLCIVSAAGPAFAVPATAPNLDNTPFKAGNQAAPKGEGGNTSALPTSGTTQIVLALAAVVALIFGLRWVARRMFALPTAGGAGGAIQILARTGISPRQQVMLIQVGRRLVLVANCGAQMNSLCEITDAEEVAELAAQVRQGKPDVIARTFGSIFGRAEKQFASGDETAKEEPAGEMPEAEDDPALADAQKELNGLKEKVRGLARQFDHT